jgi:hypothetical protein
MYDSKSWQHAVSASGRRYGERAAPPEAAHVAVEPVDFGDNDFREARSVCARAALIEVPQPAFHLRAVVVTRGGRQDEAGADVLRTLEDGAGAAEHDDDDGETLNT